MAWKIERWLAEVFPGEDAIYSEYRLLPRRELAIVSAAVLDIALAELISLRLRGPASEIEDFLGANGDGRAPAGSFGARIQLSLLIGILEAEDAAILRLIKQLRNIFAHRAKVDFDAADVTKLTVRLQELLAHRIRWLNDAGLPAGNTVLLEQIKPYLATEPEAGAALLLGVFSVYQAYFHRLHSRMEPVPPVQ